ncbi:Phosphatidate cytidylyltransferase [Actinomyces bovis]|uniref:Phosphatidate cytidylyltransferase n=1 Tax=Actinomyces bovis TaxID=1658 RepID=A0ABY1VR64_9ACTO|nr:phosphatidate cytidylyltransferase [Actinomyces bovis]SPT54156.1 Phosphatidate cytidylyltransferase [Actinomyces bovis]VEG53583.1 Phosphatidate cytidylyltransferase [Actinomyces israelii]
MNALIPTGVLDWLLSSQRDWTVHLPVVDIVLTGRAVFLALTAITVLLLAGIGVAASGKAELERRWITWAIIIPVVGIPIWMGRGTTAFLAAALALQAIREFSKLTHLPRAETILLALLAIGYPIAAWLRPELLGLAPLMVLVCALPAVLAGDTADGVRRASLTGFASVWIAWSLAHLVVLWQDAFLIAFAASAADVAAWCGGKGLRRFAWARRPLSPLSPNKTWGGLVGAVIGGVLVLLLLGHLTPGYAVAVAVGGVLGDLLESLVKRTSGVKDAGAWLPGFGGLLDRVDSLLLVLPLAAVLG